MKLFLMRLSWAILLLSLVLPWNSSTMVEHEVKRAL
jgi:hypothetical protein